MMSKAVFIVSLITAVVLAGCSEKSVLKHKIVNVEDISYPGTKRIVIRVVVEKNVKITEESVKNTANAIYEEIYSDVDEFTVFFYIKGMNTKSLAYATVEITPMGVESVDINKNALKINKTKG